MVRTETATVAAPELPTTPARDRRAFWWFVACVALALVPIVVATVRAIHREWIPVGDDAFFVIRARDVFNQHRPLLGTWTSASTTVGIDLNNPGPLLFDVLAPFVVLGGANTGVAVGAAVLNSLAVGAIAYVAYRRGGPLLGALAMVVAATLCWSMGSELLYDPWQPHTLVLPFLLLLMLVWSLGCRDAYALPWAILVASLLAQTHLSYALLVPALVLFGIAALAYASWRVRRRAVDDDGAQWRSLRVRLVRTSAISAAVLVICWIQPVIEQFTSDGPGNITRLVRTSRDSNVDTAGFAYATKAVASVLSLAPFWLRPSFDETFFDAAVWRPPSLAAALASLAGLGVLVALAFVLGWRRRDRTTVVALSTALVAGVVGFATVARAPITIFGSLTPHSSRWLWALGAFLVFGIAGAGLRALPATRHRAVVVGLTVLLAVVVGLDLPTHDSANGPQSQLWAIPGTRALNDQLARADGLDADAPFLIDGLFQKLFDPYGTAVAAELQRRDISFVVENPGLVRQFGPERAYDAGNARNELLLETGDAAQAGVPGARRIALFEALTDAERDELDATRRDVVTALEREGTVELNGKGRAAAARGELPNTERVLTGDSFDAAALVASGEVRLLIARGLIGVPGEDRATFERYEELQREWDDETVALFVRPIAA
jgi:hypothetical protein